MFFFSPPTTEIGNRQDRSSANLQCLFKQSRAWACACVHAHEWLTWTPSQIAVFCSAAFWGLVPFFSILHLFSKGNLFNKSVSCEEHLYDCSHLPSKPPPPRKDRLVTDSKDWEIRTGSLSVYGAAGRAAFNCSTYWAQTKAQNHCSLSPWTVVYINNAINIEPFEDTGTGCQCDCNV